MENLEENLNTENLNSGSLNPVSFNSGNIYSEFNSDFTEISKTDPLNNLSKDKLILYIINSYLSNLFIYKKAINNPNKYK